MGKKLKIETICFVTFYRNNKLINTCDIVSIYVAIYLLISLLNIYEIIGISAAKIILIKKQDYF